MSTDSLALAEGFLLGLDDGFTTEFKILVKETGVLHLVAASGANLAFLESLLIPYFFFLGFKGKKIVLFVFVLAYFFIVGESGSLWRALVMWILAWTGQWCGRRTSLGILLFQAVVFTAIFATELLSSASFWLSWLAMVGMWFSCQVNIREKYYRFSPNWKKYVFLNQQSFFVGWCILWLVSLWLWTQYEVFQPQGIVVTMGIEPFIPIYMVVAVFWKCFHFLSELLPGPVFAFAEMGAVQFLDFLFLPIHWWLRLWRSAMASRGVGPAVQSAIVLFGTTLLFRNLTELRKWRQRRTS